MTKGFWIWYATGRVYNYAKYAEYAEYAEYAKYAEYANYAEYAEYAEFIQLHPCHPHSPRHPRRPRHPPCRDLETWRPWDLETLRPWDLETWRPWDLGILRPWEFETMRLWDLETLRPWDLETLRPWDLETPKSRVDLADLSSPVWSCCKCIYSKNLITKRSYYGTNKYFQQLCLTSKAIEKEISSILNTGRRGGRGISYCTSFFNSAIQTVSVRNSASSFLTFPLQQLEMADRKQHMVKRTETQDKARSHPVQPSPKQK